MQTSAWDLEQMTSLELSGRQSIDACLLPRLTTERHMGYTVAGFSPKFPIVVCPSIISQPPTVDLGYNLGLP